MHKISAIPSILSSRSAASDSEIARRWDANSAARSTELLDNGDPSYRALKNLVFESLADHEVPVGSKILDVGSGLGYLAAEMAASGYQVDGIDPSAESVAKATQLHDASGGNVAFFQGTLQDFAVAHGDRKYAALVANMTLHCAADLQGFMFAAAKMLQPNGVLIATIPNPGTYLQSRADVDVSGIDLRVEQTLEIEFRIRNHAPHPEKVLFFHRPIRIYSVAADNAGLPLLESRVPDHVGPGRSRDVAVLEFAPSQRS